MNNDLPSIAFLLRPAVQDMLRSHPGMDAVTDRVGGIFVRFPSGALLPLSDLVMLSARMGHDQACSRPDVSYLHRYPN